MAISFGLDDIREAAERRFNDIEVDLGGDMVLLKNPLRLSKEQRKGLADASESLKDEGEDVEIVESFKRMFEALTSKADAEKLAAAFGEDATLYVALFEEYNKAAQVGEV